MLSQPRMQAAEARALGARDLAAVVSIDAALSGRSRGAYFERRLAAAQRDPERHLQLAIDDDGRLAGFILGRALEGEFGRVEPEVRLEAFGVAPARQKRGLGGALAAAFEDAALARGWRAVRTTALWREHSLLAFLDRAGFGLAPVHVLDCAPSADFDPPARDGVEVGVLARGDVEAIARLDRRHTGRERRGYLCRVVGEALAGSAVRVSLAARVDSTLAGYLLARLDYGDFGRAEPVAVIDTVGVDPLRARQGVGRAMLSQLFMNLAALKVERVETVLAPGNLDLLGFFYSAGFSPSERLSLVKHLH